MVERYNPTWRIDAQSSHYACMEAHPEGNWVSVVDHERQIAELRAEYDKLLTSWAESRERHLAAEADKARLSEALRETDCPRPCNGRPDDFSAGDCFDAGECGCGVRAALSGSGAGGWRPTHRHVRRGSEYMLLGIGKMQSENWCDLDKYGDPFGIDMREVAIYRSVDDGSLWVRPREEFEDGRFEALPAAPTGEAS